MIGITNVRVKDQTSGFAHLNISEIDTIFLEKAHEFLEVLFCWAIVPAVRPHSLKDHQGISEPS